MTQNPEHPAPPGPTPEEISARLEALLKRTHEMRQAQRPIGPDGPAWPPSDRDLEAVDVVDVPQQGPGAISRDAFREPNADARPETPTAETDDRPSFGRPDWSTLRMRETPVEVPRTPAWVWLLVAGLVLALGLETAYLLRTTPWAAAGSGTTGPGGAAPAGASVRLEGPAGFGVSSDGGEPRALPAAIAVEGDAPVRLVIGRLPAEAATAPPTAAGAGVPAAPAQRPADAAPNAASAEPPSPAPTPATPASATRGAVHIESTPGGAMVTMEGRERGPTPITIDGLRPGRHDVLVVGPAGGRLFRVDVSAGATTRLDATLPSPP